ncbi:MAG TPA: mandelate racemase/muconate lactonizing enzyme family protein [Microlunatus sp.]|nr:mandelate racemase/muconate lactonizing enzyme family protein [Microlunatus sp.]
MRLTSIETITLPADSWMPGLLFVRLTADDGLHGAGDTFYLPQACAEVVHRDIAPALLGQDPRLIGAHWQRLWNAYSRIAGHGAEVRALSVVDVALWDLLGKRAGLPLYQLLGATGTSVPTYNTCGGPRYATTSQGSGAGHGSAEVTGTLDDFDAFLHRPAELARDLVAEGFAGMKLWPFDRLAHANGGLRVTAAELEVGVEPVRLIREAVGDAIEIMIDGHGLWSLDAARQVARSLEPYHVRWAEDLILADRPDALRRLRAGTTVPICASEYLVGRGEYLNVITADGCDIVMIDPTWAGGITESRRIAALAESFGLPVTYHDCTGPLTLLAGVHLSQSTPNVLYQESVRAFLRTFYPELVTALPTFADGRLSAPDGPGLGAEINDAVLSLPGVDHRVSAC